MPVIAMIVPWDELEKLIAEAEKTSEEDRSDFLPRTIEGFWRIHRYDGEFLRVLELHPTPAAKDVFEGG